jgi:hypothetical protein
MSPQYQIFPNPVTNYFVIKPLAKLDERIKLAIFSNEGLLFKECELMHPDDNHEYVVDVRNLPPGSYYLMIHSEKGNVIERMNKR